MASFFARLNRLATVFGGDLAGRVHTELKMTIPLNPQVSSSDIFTMLMIEKGTALWLDQECILASLNGHSNNPDRRYRIIVSLSDGDDYEGRHCIELYQAPGTTERGAPLPALDYLVDRLTNYDGVDSFDIYPNKRDNIDETLNVSPACFANMLRTSRENPASFFRCSVSLNGFTLTAEQTKLLFAYDTGPIFIDLDDCRFHGPTLLQLGEAALRREETHVLGRGSYLTINLYDRETGNSLLGELTALLSNRHLRSFRPFSSSAGVSYEKINDLVSALSANTSSRLECLSLNLDKCEGEIDWEKRKEPSMWISMWKLIEHHPSLKEIRLDKPPKLSQESWWYPVAAAVKVNPRLVHVHVGPTVSYGFLVRIGLDCPSLAEHVEPLLERNRYRPKIAALCRTDPSKAAALLVQAIVAVARKKNAKSRREIHRLLLDQLVLTGYDFGVGLGRVLGKKCPLADTVAVVPNDILATTETEPLVADSIAASASHSSNESNL